MDVSSIKKFFKKRPEVLFAVLFGSRAKGRYNRLSDIDIGVYLSKRIKKSQFLDFRLNSISNCPAKGTKDIVILNESPPLLAYEVISHGKPIIIRDKKSFFNFKALTFSRYLDTHALRTVQYEALTKRIKEGQIGNFKRNNSIKVAKIRELSRKIKRIAKAH